MVSFQKFDHMAANLAARLIFRKPQDILKYCFNFFSMAIGADPNDHFDGVFL